MDSEVLREYNGEGTFTFKTDKLCEQKAKFTLLFFSNSRIIVHTEFALTKENLSTLTMVESSVEGDLNGSIVDKNNEIGHISIEGLLVTSSGLSAKSGENVKNKVSMICLSNVDIVYSDEKSIDVESHYGLTNFVFLGCEYSKNGRSRILDKFKANIRDLSFLFKKVENYAEIKSRLTEKKGCFVTAEAIVNLSIDSTDESKEIIFDISRLLSLATRNYISPIYEDHFYEGRIIKTTLNPVLAHTYNGSDQLIDVDSPTSCSIKYFLETTYDSYQEYKNTLRLNAIISLYLTSGVTPYTEAKFMLMFVAVESLLSNFENYLETIGETIVPSLQKSTKKKLIKVLKKEDVPLEDEIIDKIVESIAYPHTTFDDKLNALIKKYRIDCTSEDKSLMRLRNKVVHDGKFPEELDTRAIDPYEEYTRLVFFIDRTLLTILNYKDKPFLNKLENYKETTL
ncbi:MAG: hypothetical protein K8R11_03690 [Methanococcoides sp.]|nr:hypothetical protein [Methanococcoides sp.]